MSSSEDLNPCKVGLKFNFSEKGTKIWYNLPQGFDITNALYRSQNVLCRSKFFVSDQKFIYILCQSQTFCARKKDDLHSVKLVFVRALNFSAGKALMFYDS